MTTNVNPVPRKRISPQRMKLLMLFIFPIVLLIISKLIAEFKARLEEAQVLATN